MVDFRYHVVSIVAVFLALAVGIVLGSTALERPVIDDLQRNVRRLAREKDAQRDLADARADQLGDEAAFARAIAPQVVSGRLTGRRVVVVSAAGVPRELRDTLVDMVELAGATVTGRVRLLDGAAADAARSGSQIARLLTPDRPNSAAVLETLTGSGVIAVDGPAPVPAPLVLVLLARPSPTTSTPSPSPSPVGDPALEMLRDLAERPLTIVAATPRDGAEPGTSLAAVRGDAVLRAGLSSVDGVDTVTGQIGVVLAFDIALAGVRGHYGSGPGATNPVPTPTPLPR